MAEAHSYMEPQLMPDVLDLREITFTNLLVLQFDPDAYEAKYRVPFNRDMFAFPNKKGMEVVLYFLFSALNTDATKDKFRHCWPVYDKKQEHAFRKVVVKWLSQLSKEDPEFGIPTAFASVLLNPGGDKFYLLLFHFSTYVLRTKLKEVAGKNLRLPPYPHKSGATKTVSNELSKIYADRTMVDTLRLLEFTTSAIQIQENWLSFSSDLLRERRALCKEKRDWERKILDQESRTRDWSHARSTLAEQSPHSKDVQAVKRTKKLQRVRHQVREITELYEDLTKTMGMIDDILKGSLEKQLVKGPDLPLKVPERLLREFEDEIHRRKIQNIYHGDKLNLISLVELWNLSLVMIKDKLQTLNLPDFTEEEAQMRSQLHNHNACLELVQSLSSSLSKDMLPDLRASIRELQETADTHGEKQAKKAFEITKLEFELMPPTPNRFSMEAATPEKIPNVERTSVFATSDLKTPDAVSTLLQSARVASHVKTNQSAVVPTEATPQKRERKMKRTLVPTLKKDSKVSNNDWSSAKEDSNNTQLPVKKKENRDEVKHIKKAYLPTTTPRRVPKTSQELLADRIVADVISKRPTSKRWESSESESSQSDSNQEPTARNEIPILDKNISSTSDYSTTPQNRHLLPVGNIVNPLSPREDDTRIESSGAKSSDLTTLISRYQQLKLRASMQQFHKENTELEEPLDKAEKNMEFAVPGSILVSPVFRTKEFTLDISPLKGESYKTDRENVSADYSPRLFSEDIEDDIELLSAVKMPIFDSPVFTSRSISPLSAQDQRSEDTNLIDFS